MSLDLSQWQLTILVFALTLGWVSLRKKESSSELDNVPGPPPESWAAGNFQQLLDPTKGWDFNNLLVEKYGTTSRAYAGFGGNMLYTFDPKAMQSIFVKDHHIFEESDAYTMGNGLIFGKGLLGTLGHQHRQQRKMLNPVFALAHMRDMVPTFFDVVRLLEGALKKRLEAGPEEQEVDMLSWMGRTAFELIGRSGLGYSFDPMTDEQSAHPYSKILKELLPTAQRLMFWLNYLLPLVINIGSPKFRRFVVNLVPWKDVHTIRDMVDYMYEIATEIYEGKKRAFEQGDEAVSNQLGSGKDLISVLMKENMKASDEDRLDDSEVISQMSTLLFAAMDTTSSGMSRMLHLLSKHPHVQEKLRQELTKARRDKDGGDLTYEELMALPYLDACCRETLRLYPPVPFAIRVARQDAVVPLSKPIKGIDGTEMVQIPVPRGSTVFVPIIHANKHPDLWGADAAEWKPERWLEELPEALIKARVPGVYSHLMTFLGGARACIGFNFAQLEMKVVMSVLLENFKFSPSAQDSEIFWQMNSVVAPVVGKVDLHPQLPLKISLVKKY